MEVALLSEPSPKAEAAPPAPPKKAPPKKKAVKPPVKKKEPVIRKQAERPKPQPVTDEPTPAQPSPSEATQKAETPVSGAPSASKPTGIAGNGEARTKAVSSGVVELGCPKPKYPMRAMSRHIEGWVKIELIISAAGTVTNAKFVGAQPPGIFDDAALDATQKCKFKPKIVDGRAVTQIGSKVSRFKITN
jgi:protein TonB